MFQEGILNDVKTSSGVTAISWTIAGKNRYLRQQRDLCEGLLTISRSGLGYTDQDSSETVVAAVGDDSDY